MNLFEKVEKGEDDIVFVYTICGNLEDARAMGYSAVKEKLAISMDYWIINSIYPWQSVIQEVGQYMLMFSTQKKLGQKLIKHIESEHKYNVPMIAKCDIAMTNLPYSLWVDDTLKSDEKINTQSDLNNTDINSLNKLK